MTQLRARRKLTPTVISLSLAFAFVAGCGTTTHGASTTSSGLGLEPSGTSGFTGSGANGGAGLGGAGSLGGAGGLAGDAGEAGASGGAQASGGSATSSGSGQLGGGGPSATSSLAVGGQSGSGPLVPPVFKIGVMDSSNANAALSSLGSGTANAQADAEAGTAMLDYVNKHGGIAGRPVAYDTNNVDATASPELESQQACDQWTQDDHVTFAVPGSAVEDNDLLRTCLGQAGIPSLYGSIYSNTLDSSFASSPLWFEYTTVSNNEYARTYVKGLASQGFFKSGKVGIVYYDQPPFSTTLNSTLLPDLKAAGVANPDIFGADINGVSDLESGSTQMSSAVLRFRADGVTKVLFFEPWVGYFVFMEVAREQGYTPTYGISSQEAPEVVMSLGLLSPDELTGAHIVSWIPLGDVGNLTPYLGPLTATCTAIFKSYDVSIQPASDRLDFSVQYGGCEDLLLIQTAYEHAGRVLTADDFVQGMQAMGTSVKLATRPAGSFSATKHYGISEFWNGHFDSGCGCFVYDGGPQPLP